jgi:hypothetical protein
MRRRRAELFEPRSDQVELVLLAVTRPSRVAQPRPPHAILSAALASTYVRVRRLCSSLASTLLEPVPPCVDDC